MPRLKNRRCASSRALQELKDVTPADAASIRAIWLSTMPNRREARDAIDALFGTFGVEFLGVHRRTGESVYYCNAGDTYAATIIFHGPRLSVGCWGDLVERNAVREPRHTDRD